MWLSLPWLLPTSGQVPEKQVQVAKEMVTQRFGTANIYFVLDKLVSGAVRQLQNALGQAGNALDFVPGMDAMVKVGKMFIGISLNYVDECCLGYTFYQKEQNAFKSAGDGVVIYAQNGKRLLQDAANYHGDGHRKCCGGNPGGISFLRWLVCFVGLAGHCGVGLGGESMATYRQPCIHCGFFLHRFAQFCSSCGSGHPFGYLCPACHRSVVKGQAVCPECGSPCYVNCPFCGQRTFVQEYCEQCSTSLMFFCANKRCGASQFFRNKKCTACGKALKTTIPGM